MGCFTGRCFVLCICVLQEIATSERQIFDFLGYMWAPIIANFLQIIFVIFGFFGTYQFRPKYLVMYITWTVIWLAWNVFIVCVYLEVGSLKKDNSILNMGTGSRSWWEVNGIGCNPKYNVSSITEDGWKKPVAIDGCLLDYENVEIVHAATQIALGLIGLIGACYLVQSFTQEDDSFRAKKQIPVLPYSIEYRRSTPQTQENAYQKPMTPRKVKRRSTRSKRAAHSYRQSYYQNPVTRIMNQSSVYNPRLAPPPPPPPSPPVAAGGESSTSNDSYSNLPPPSYSSGQSAPPAYSSGSTASILGLNAAHLQEVAGGGIVNPGYQSRPLSEYDDRQSHIYMNNSETVM
uniref:Sodium/potassium-transporting ATPase subunit beta-1-interacting protein n=1 Tax=Strigamia maritima TaxID=126957 RepID=T1IVU4_STRMM